MEVFPNPLSGNIGRLTLKTAMEQDVSIAMYDPLGRQILTLYEGRLLSNLPYSFDIPTYRLASGSYYVMIRGESARRTESLIVVR